jgi:ADP-heptose:LPS heptosyltransferase
MKELCNIFRVRGGIGDALLACCKMKTIAQRNKNIKNVLIISEETIMASNVMSIYEYIIFIDQIIVTSLINNNHKEQVFGKYSPIHKIIDQFHPDSKKFDLNFNSDLMSKIESTALTLEEIQLSNKETSDYICIQPRSRQLYTRDRRRDWNSFLKFAKIIYEKTGYKSVILGSKNDGLNNIKNEYIVNLAGKKTLRESMKLILNSRAMVGTTSWSPLFAAIFKIPCIHINAVDLTPIFLQLFEDMGGNFNISMYSANSEVAFLANKLIKIIG